MQNCVDLQISETFEHRAHLYFEVIDLSLLVLQLRREKLDLPFLVTHPRCEGVITPTIWRPGGKNLKASYAHGESFNFLTVIAQRLQKSFYLRVCMYTLHTLHAMVQQTKPVAVTYAVSDSKDSVEPELLGVPVCRFLVVRLRLLCST